MVKRVIKHYNAFIVVVLISLRLHAQDSSNTYHLAWTQFSDANGISHKHVNQTFQDSRGLLWLVTPNGLNVFDSHRAYLVSEWPVPRGPWFVKIRTEDNQGLLWLRSLDEDKLEFKLFDIETREERPLFERIDSSIVGLPMDVAVDHQGNLLLINQKGELWMEANGQRWRQITSGLGAFTTFCTPRQASDQIWMSTEKTNLHFPQDLAVKAVSSNGKWGKTKYIKNFISMSSGPSGDLWVLCPDKVGFVYASGSESWVDMKQLNNGKPVRDFFNAEYDYRTGNLWIWNQDELSVIRLFVESGNKIQWKLLVSKELLIVPIGMDIGLREGIYINTTDGVFFPSLSKDNFRRILWRDNQITSPLDMREARGMLETSDGRIFALAGNYLYEEHRTTGAFSKVADKNFGIANIAEDPSMDAIWLGGLEQVILSSMVVSNYLNPYYSSVGNTWSLAFLNDHLILLGTSGGVIEFSVKDKRFSAFEGYHPFDELKTSDVYHICRDKSGIWWILSSTGLYQMDSSGQITAQFGSSQQGRYFLPAKNFRHFYQDRKGVFWFATAEGLLKWNRKSGDSELITTTNGLSNNNLYAVYGDDNDFLWISSNHGIIRYDPELRATRIFLEKDGITHNEFNRISHLKTRDGTLYFGGINGITSFHPNDFFTGKGEKSYEVLVMSVKAFQAGQTISDELITNYKKNGEIRLSPGTTLLKIDFVFPDYAQPNAVSYSYKMEGINESWVHTSLPEVQLLGLGPGNYTLTIQARSGSGLISSRPCKIKLEVLPPFYQTFWFRLLILLSTLLCSWGVIRYRDRRAKARQAELEALVKQGTDQIRRDKELIEEQAGAIKFQKEAQQRFFSNITHEFRTPLALIMGPIEVVSKQASLSKRFKSLLTIAQNNSRRVLELVDNVLTISSLDMGQFLVREEPVYPEPLFHSIVEELQLLAEQKSIQLVGTCSIEPSTLIAIDLRLIRMIMNNLVSNAIKFTNERGAVHIALKMENQNLILEVSDTGRGIPSDDLPRIFERYFQTSQPDAPLEGGTGIGLALVKELLERAGGTISVQSEVGVGSVFTVSLPWVPVLDNYTAKSQMPSSSPVSKTHPGGKIESYSILLVEDNLELQQYLEYLLNNNYQVLTVSNGRDALECLAQGEKPDLIITDWMMPIMDGYQLVQHLKTDSELASIPVLFLTARSGDEDITSAFRLGVDDYLLKPFEDEALLAIVEQLIYRYIGKTNLQNMDISNIEGQKLQEEQRWLEQLEAETKRGISDELFSVDRLAALMLMGRTNFYKEVKRLTGLTPNEYILEARLMKARQIMETQSGMTLKKVVQMVGLKDEGNFSKAFKKRFGQSPSSYL